MGNHYHSIDKFRTTDYTLTCFNLPYFCVRSNPGPGFSCIVVSVVYNDCEMKGSCLFC